MSTKRATTKKRGHQPIRKAEPKAQPAEQISPLGRKLMRARARIAASGLPQLSWDEIEREVRLRRGGIR